MAYGPPTPRPAQPPRPDDDPLGQPGVPGPGQIPATNPNMNAGVFQPGFAAQGVRQNAPAPPMPSFGPPMPPQGMPQRPAFPSLPPQGMPGLPPQGMGQGLPLQAMQRAAILARLQGL